MQHVWHHDPSRGDLAFELTAARLADERRAAATERLVRHRPDRIPRLRQVVGGWLIALGRAIQVPPAASRDPLAR